MAQVRVLLVASSHTPNGIDRYTDLLDDALRRRGIAVLTIPPPRSSSSLVHQIRFGMRRVIGPLETGLSWRAVEAAAAAHRADVVHYTYPEYVSPWTKVPAVVNVWHSHPRIGRRTLTARQRDGSRRSEFLYALSDRIAFRRADRLLAVSLPARDAAAELNPNVEWVPPFIPTSSRPSGRREPFALMIATRLHDKRKNAQLAVEAVRLARRERPDLELIMVGRWEGEGLPSFCKDVGFQTHDEIEKLLGRAVCAVLPSTYEEFGYVGLEALAAGCPLVVGPLDGFVGLTAPGLQVVERTPEEFAAAIIAAEDVSAVSLPSQCTEDVGVQRVIGAYEAVA